MGDDSRVLIEFDEALKEHWDKHKSPIVGISVLRAPKQRVYHRASKTRADGSVSALCFKRPRPISLRDALWTLRDEAVTCPRCRAIIDAGGK